MLRQSLVAKSFMEISDLPSVPLALGYPTLLLSSHWINWWSTYYEWTLRWCHGWCYSHHRTSFLVGYQCHYYCTGALSSSKGSAHSLLAILYPSLIRVLLLMWFTKILPRTENSVDGVSTAWLITEIILNLEFLWFSSVQQSELLVSEF